MRGGERLIIPNYHRGEKKKNITKKEEFKNVVHRHCFCGGGGGGGEPGPLDTPPGEAAWVGRYFYTPKNTEYEIKSKVTCLGGYETARETKSLFAFILSISFRSVLS